MQKNCKQSQIVICLFFFSNLLQIEKGLKEKRERYDRFCFCSSITKTNKILYLIIIAGTKTK